jgi:hypothetical protein
MTSPETIIRRIEQASVYYTQSGCLEYLQGRTPDGYGLIHVDGKKDYPHRLMLKALGGDIDGLTVDHLCERKACSNPRHLEAVTREEKHAPCALL